MKPKNLILKEFNKKKDRLELECLKYKISQVENNNNKKVRYFCIAFTATNIFNFFVCLAKYDLKKMKFVLIQSLSPVLEIKL
jgi:hypothetical protein